MSHTLWLFFSYNIGCFKNSSLQQSSITLLNNWKKYLNLCKYLEILVFKCQNYILLTLHTDKNVTIFESMSQGVGMYFTMHCLHLIYEGQFVIFFYNVYWGLFNYTSIEWDKIFGVFVKDLKVSKLFFLFEYLHFLPSKKKKKVHSSLGNSENTLN